MVQAVHGGAYPLVSVRAHLDAEPAPPAFKADVTVDFGGRQEVYKGVSFQVADSTPNAFRVTGRIPLELSRHNVDRPSLLGVAIKDSAPVDLDVQWKKGG
jgi:hypothetical protein